MEAKKYFIYVRKSTRGDRRQALSIPAQLRELNRIAIYDNIKIVDRIEERQSAHTPGRPEFGKMMRRIEKGEATGIMSWHPDRLARNAKDGGEIIDFLDRGILTDLKFCSFWFENTPQGKANLGHEFVQSKQSSDKLSLDTKRGQREKAQTGHFPGRAKRGYLNDKGNKTIVLDPVVGPLMKKAFEMYAKSDLTLEDMQIRLGKMGILTKKIKSPNSTGGKWIHCDYIANFLRDPFYYGAFRYSGVLYDGKHPSLVSKGLFDKVQEKLAGRAYQVSPKKEPKAFTRLLRCGECQMMITAEVQKNHIYYRCTRKSRSLSCSQSFVREESLDAELSQLLRQFAMPKKVATYLLGRIEDERNQLTRNARKILEEKNRQITDVALKQQKLLETYLDETISYDEFSEFKVGLTNKKRRLEEQIEAVERSDESWLERFKNWVLTAQSLDKILLKGSPKEKRALALKIFGSNLTLFGKKAHGKAVKSWALLQNLPHDLDVVQLHACARPIFFDDV